MPAPECKLPKAGTDYWELRIAAIFILLVGAGFGAVVPVVLARAQWKLPTPYFFVAKYIGTGVILSTAWMHLLSPASDNLRDPCLSDILPRYDWAMGIGLMTVMFMFLVELLVSHIDFGFGSAEFGPPRNDQEMGGIPLQDKESQDVLSRTSTERISDPNGNDGGTCATWTANRSTLGEDSTLGKNMSGTDLQSTLYRQSQQVRDFDRQSIMSSHSQRRGKYIAQITSIFILEFGVIFHSIFIGLTLAVTEQFILLFIVVLCHQTLEGLGIGARMALAEWPNGIRRHTPYFLALLYGVTTPIALAIGLATHNSMTLQAWHSKLVNGIFDAVSGGILMYTSLVELLAHEFLFAPEMRKASLKKQLTGYMCVAAGVLLMSILAKWI